MTTALSQTPGPLQRLLAKLAPADASASGSLLRNSLPMVSGTVASQAILFLLSPVLSRVFSLADFGLLANFNAWLTLLALLGSLRYEHAIIVANGREETVKVVALVTCLTLSSFLAYLVLAAGLYFAPTDAAYITELRPIVLFLPFGVLVACLSSLFVQLNVKSGRFKRLAVVTTLQVVLTVLPQIALGLLGVRHGLIIGTIIGYVFFGSVFAVLFFDRHRLRDLLAKMTPREVWDTARAHINFPRYTLAADAIAVVVQLFVPVFVLALFGPALAGAYAFAIRIVRVPALVVSTAVAAALRKEAMEHVHAGRDLQRLFSGTARTLFLLGVGPFLIILFFGRQIFTVVFGNQWVEAGKLVQVLSPGLLLEFVALPLAVFFLVTSNQRHTMRIQFAGFVMLVAAFGVGRYYFDDFVATCYIVSAALVVVNLASIVLAGRVSNSPAAVSAVAH